MKKYLINFFLVVFQLRPVSFFFPHFLNVVERRVAVTERRELLDDEEVDDPHRRETQKRQKRESTVDVAIEGGHFLQKSIQAVWIFKNTNLFLGQCLLKLLGKLKKNLVDEIDGRRRRRRRRQRRRRQESRRSASSFMTTAP